MMAAFLAVAVWPVEAEFQVSRFSFVVGSCAALMRQDTANLISLDSGNVVGLDLVSTRNGHVPMPKKSGPSSRLSSLTVSPPFLPTRKAG